jgi:predicted N-formylglutamate amidohydrolase
MNAERWFSVSLTIHYRNPERPDEAGIIMIADQAKAAAMIDQLEDRGFVVDKVTYGPSPKSAQAD